MILYKTDWARYPNAMIHLNTKNQSWVHLAQVYKYMGVKNHNFLLALHNPMLEYVDPYDPNLTEKLRMAIVVECKVNPWYFFREVLRVTASGSINGAPVKANRLNIAIWWLYFNHVTSYNIIGRQMGKSTTMFGLDAYLLGIGTRSTDLHLFTKDNNLRVKSIAQIKEMLESLPWYLFLKNRKDTYNTEKITISRLNNVYHTSVAQPSAKSAEGVGRGFTVSNHRVDEFNFVANIDISLPVLLSSSTAAVDSARKNNGYFGNIFASTAGYLSSKEGRYGYKIYNSCFRWTEMLLDSDSEEELVNYIKKNSPAGDVMVLCEFSHRQLGYTDEWIQDKIRAAMAEGDKAEAEFLNKWPEGNEASPIDPNTLKAMHASIVGDPITTVTPYGYIIRWYIPRAEVESKVIDRKLIVGLDTSDAVGNDDIAMCIRDASSGEVVATGIYNETNLITFSNWLVDFLEEYPTTTLVIERKSSGVTIIDNILLLLPTRMIDPFKRVFNWAVNDMELNPETKADIFTPLANRSPGLYNKYRKDFGYATSGSGRASRDNLYGAAFNASIKYTHKTVRDKTLYQQLSGLVRRNDRIDHRPGEHDDLCVSWLMGYWFLTNAKNLSHYGLSPRSILVTVSHAMIEEEGGMDAMIQQNEQAKLLRQIEDLANSLKTITDPYKAEMIYNKINYLSRDLSEDTSKKFNMESLLETIKRDRRKQYSNINLRMGF